MSAPDAPDFGDERIVLPPDPEERIFGDAPTLHFSSSKPITLEDLKRAIARGTRVPLQYSWQNTHDRTFDK